MINLEKGGRINLSKDLVLSVARVGLGWDPNQFGGSSEAEDFDLDASVFVLNAQGKALSEQHFVFYNNRTSPEGAITHSGDNRTGGGEGDDETILVDLSKLPSHATDVSFVVTIHEADKRKQNFGMVRNSHIRIYDGKASDDAKPLAEYRLEDEFSAQTAVQFGNLTRRGNEWLFVAVGEGYRRGLGDFVKAYGLTA